MTFLFKILYQLFSLTIVSVFSTSLKPLSKTANMVSVIFIVFLKENLDEENNCIYKCGK